MSPLLEAPVQIAVVDYGMGNRRSVEKALLHVGARASVTSDPAELRAADGLVVPGVGAFPRGMESLRSLGLDDLLRERVESGTPVLGTATYGAPFVTAVQRGSFYGVQFHPEKSSAAGMRLLANFARVCMAPAEQGAVGSAGGSTPR